MTKNLEVKYKIVAAYSAISENEYPSLKKIKEYLQVQGISVSEPTISSYLSKANVRRLNWRKPAQKVNIETVEAACISLLDKGKMPTIKNIAEELGGVLIYSVSETRKKVMNSLITERNFNDILSGKHECIIFENRAILNEVAPFNILIAMSKNRIENECILAHHAILMALQFQKPCALFLCETTLNQAICSAVKQLNLTEEQIGIVNNSLSILALRDIQKWHFLYTVEDYFIKQIRFLYGSGCKHIFTQSFLTSLNLQKHTPDKTLLEYSLTAIKKVRHSMTAHEQTFTCSEHLHFLSPTDGRELFNKASILWYSPLFGTQYAT